MNKSEILKALEWVDQTAKEGDPDRLAKAKEVLETEILSAKKVSAQEDFYQTAFESFVRKHGREPLEDIETD